VILTVKMKALIYDLLLTEAWKEKVYPLLKKEAAQQSSIRLYMAVSSTCLTWNSSITKRL